MADYAIAELADALRDRLLAHPGDWFSSARRNQREDQTGRVRVWCDAGGTIQRACFYREGGGMLPYLAIAGPVVLSGEDVRQLLRDRRANYASLSLMAAPDLAGPPARRWFDPRPHPVPMRVIPLPDTADAFLARLGKQTRKHLPYYVRRLQKEWVDFEFVHAMNGDIGRDSFEQLIALNRSRMEAKGSAQYGWTPELVEWRWRLAGQCGLLCGIRHDSRLVAGTFSYVHGDAAYLDLIGHDPVYDKLNAGNASLWLTIQHLIASGLRNFNLMWAGGFYKEQFGSEEQMAYNLVYCAGLGPACLYRALAAGRYAKSQSQRALRLLRRVCRGSAQLLVSRHASSG